jgi:hypothetical protein
MELSGGPCPPDHMRSTDARRGANRVSERATVRSAAGRPRRRTAGERSEEDA